ncbi:TetR/AcrR family transcriptional regulator [Afipia massiliensis]|uniref:TetR/AcrR family transcriptional regulator n=1 Tax=Afipia massiliensis TaxID=211460 RepID=A0A4U6BQS1_9BRAD|nr:TetR/AcrR family transcriptional regulator [Afipia massiliensis]TKT71875.1 TetR/AcrR family transcriptional regulator [Afipia massiliensis]
MVRSHMVRSSAETKARIVKAAYALFWRHGFVRASLDDIAEHANVTKRTLYQHFRSKDDLMAVVLAEASALGVERVRRYFEGPPESADAIIDAMFAELIEWASRPHWAGTGFTRVAFELADLPGHPARAIARHHKTSMESLCADLFDRAGLASPLERARQVMLVWEGAVTLMLVHGDRSYVEAAAKAAKQFIDVPRERPASIPSRRNSGGNSRKHNAAGGIKAASSR